MQQSSVSADHGSQGHQEHQAAAIEDHTSASEAMEEAAREWLERRAEAKNT
jgi:hypothetical protein